ncbi:diphosphate--fructose-6-phosphate 1-phosphotransferase, partial [Bacteroidota bacterium]
ALQSENIQNIYGMNYGIEGFMKNQIIDLGNQPINIIKSLKTTPSSALGSSRHKVEEEDFPTILKVLKEYNIKYFFLIGGNDTMDTINRIELYCRKNNYDLIGVGIPKTVDNDLYGTDHTPGFASAARSNILNVKQAGVLARDMQKVDKYVIYQTIGRDSGWLGAATALAGKSEGEAPHLIYCPEFDFIKEDFLNDVKKCIDTFGWVSVVCGEGLKYQDGTPVSASETIDKFDNVEFGAMGGASVGMNLHKMIYKEFAYRGEFQITESLIMCAADRAVKNDIEEAYQCGVEAVKLAEKGETGYMISIERLSNNPYQVKYGKVLLNDVAVKAKPMPKEYFNDKGNYINDKFIEYIKPLIGELPDYVELEKKFI